METRRMKKTFVMIISLIAVFAVGATMLLPAEASAASKPKKPAQVKGLVVKAKSSTSVTIKFKKVKGAKGYKVYQSTSKNGKYKRVRTLKGNKNVRFTKTKLKSGKRYYYKVRAYKIYKRGKKKLYVYGKYSAKKSAVTKKSSSAKAKVPSPYKAVDMKQVNADIAKAKKSGRDIRKSTTNSDGEVYNYYISAKGSPTIGYINKWTDECFSVNGCAEGKWHGANFALKLKSMECTAYYTLDGSTPSPSNGTKVTKSTGRVKIKAEHTGPYGDVFDTLNLKIHFYVKGKLVALSYYYGKQEMCLHE